MTQIVCDGLTDLEVCGDGRGALLQLRTASGPVELLLPAQCLNQLLMTLPRIISLAMQARHDDKALRLVFPLQDWQLETAHGVADRLILTLATTDGFSVAFCVTHDDLAGMFVTAEVHLSRAPAAMVTVN